MRAALVLGILAVLMVLVECKPQLSLDETVDAYLQDKREEGRKRAAPIEKCTNGDCCAGKNCKSGKCTTKDKTTNFVYKFGWACEGGQCGTKPGKFAGIYCDVDPKTVCDELCYPKNGKHCSVSMANLEGLICYDKDWDLVAGSDRQMDVLYGAGTADEITRIAREYERKNSLTSLLGRLLRKLDEDD